MCCFAAALQQLQAHTLPAQRALKPPCRSGCGAQMVPSPECMQMTGCLNVVKEVPQLRQIMVHMPNEVVMTGVAWA